MSTDRCISIPAPSAATISAARHLDASEGPVRDGTVVDLTARAAINQVLRYIALAHNTQTTDPQTQKPSLDDVLRTVRETVIEANDVGGVDLNDLMYRLTRMGCMFPQEEE